MVIQRVSEIDYYLSSIVAGELFHWAFASPQKAARLKAVRSLIELAPIILIDVAIAERYGVVIHETQTAGQPISRNDLWIAATALVHDLALLTRDTDFTRVRGLKIENR